jgi:hypothetical protein
MWKSFWMACALNQATLACLISSDAFEQEKAGYLGTSGGHLKSI